VYFLAFSQMSQVMSVMSSSYLFLFGWSSDERNIEELLNSTVTWEHRGEDIFQSFYTGLSEINVPTLKSVSVTTYAGFSKNTGSSDIH
jgi:hypothetical protein